MEIIIPNDGRAAVIGDNQLEAALDEARHQQEPTPNYSSAAASLRTSGSAGYSGGASGPESGASAVDHLLRCHYELAGLVCSWFRQT
jgi:hypothetical protein